MNLDLNRALHDAVDGTGPMPTWDLLALSSRARRRRAVRHGVRGAVSVSAAGAVVLGALHLAHPSDVLPAADPDAAPGTCGSDVTPLAMRPDPTLGLETANGRGSAFRPASVDALAPPPAGESFGAYASPVAQIRVISTNPSDAAAAVLGEAVMNQDLLEKMEGWLAEGVAAAAAGEGPGPDQLEELAATVEQQRELTASFGEDLSAAASTPLAVDVLVTHDNTVVSIDDLATFVDGSPSIWIGSRTPGAASVDAVLDLKTCATDQEAGDAPLPPGSYEVWATRGGGTAAGPWSLDVLPDPGPVTGLPSDFPADVVPMPHGRLVSARHEDGGWSVEVVVHADDRLGSAAKLFEHQVEDELPVDGDFTGEIDNSDASFHVPGWTVQVTRTQTADDEPSLLYVVRPR